MPREGILFVGDEGIIAAGFLGQDPQLFPRGASADKKPEPLPVDKAVAQNDPGPRGTWQQAVKGGPPSPGDFLHAVSITDTVNLGTVALRAGRRILFDSETMKITNVEEANRYLYREYRQGWEL
jgi:hypothetical protein